MASRSVRAGADAREVDWSCWTDWLAVVGGVLQGGGLWLTVVEIIRTENRTFPERRHRVRRWLQRAHNAMPWRRGKRRVVGRSVSVGAADSIELAESAHVAKIPAIDPDDLRARIDQLEKDLEAHARDSRAAVAEVRRYADARDKLLGQRIANLANDVYGARDEDRAMLDESLARQKVGTAMFIIGTLLATVASVYA
jgi:outer membrane murein-binding lipoprotein Lpp